jgi:hypothetical protein
LEEPEPPAEGQFEEGGGQDIVNRKQEFLCVASAVFGVVLAFFMGLFLGLGVEENHGVARHVSNECRTSDGHKVILGINGKWYPLPFNANGTDIDLGETFDMTGDEFEELLRSQGIADKWGVTE